MTQKPPPPGWKPPGPDWIPPPDWLPPPDGDPPTRPQPGMPADDDPGGGPRRRGPLIALLGFLAVVTLVAILALNRGSGSSGTASTSARPSAPSATAAPTPSAPRGDQITGGTGRGGDSPAAGSGGGATPTGVRSAITALRSRVATLLSVAVPNVVGEDLQTAQEKLFPPLRSRSVDATGQGRRQIIDSNWVVVRQDPAAGSRVEPLRRVTLYVVRKSER